MKKILAVIGGAWGCAAMAVTGAGTAFAAQGVVGETYAEARADLRHEGKTPIVRSTVGDRKDWDDCLVVGASPAAGVDGYGKEADDGAVNISLNCYANFSNRLSPGFSLQSPEGQRLYREALDDYRRAMAAKAAAG